MCVTLLYVGNGVVANSLRGFQCARDSQTIPLQHIYIIPQELVSIGWKLFGTIAHESSEDSTVD